MELSKFKFHHFPYFGTFQMTVLQRDLSRIEAAQKALADNNDSLPELQVNNAQQTPQTVDWKPLEIA